MKKAGKNNKSKAPDKPVESKPAPAHCTVVGFGASAGGLEAVTEVLTHLPADCGMALVLVQHLDPKHDSMLTNLLARSTAMPVFQVTDGMRLEPNRVYVIPPNANLVISDGALHLKPRPIGQHMPIDSFFRSMASTQGANAVGVILSGNASDGTLGLKAIKEAGGITFAQEPGSARFDGMPRSAISSNIVDFVLPPQGIAEELMRLQQHPYLSRPNVVEEGATAGDERAFQDLFAQLRSATGVDFNLYKPGTLRRRVLRRMALQKIDHLGRYLAYIRQNREELTALFQDILINVTAFFREPVTFDALKAQIFPRIFEDKTSEHPVRVWVPGCATGEEVYSITIALLEYMRETGKEIPLQVFGTDLSDAALDKARSGVYPESIAADVSPERLRKFFARVNSSYQIARGVRDNCIFARQNVTKDPPFSKLDLILCRNVLIYLGPPLQGAVMRLFHYALQPGGYLVLGLSESIGQAGHLFEWIDKKVRIYARKPASIALAADLGVYHEHHGTPALHVAAPPMALNVHRKVDQLLLARYSPSAIVIDKTLRIVEFRGHTENFLEHTPGEASLNLLKMSPSAIGIEVQKLLRRVRTGDATVKGKPISVSSQGQMHSIQLSVNPIHLEGAETQYLVIMEKVLTGSRTPNLREPAAANAQAERIKDLEQELAMTREALQAVIEEQEAGTEELKSANEEVQSSNEELQSTNEELLTAKEELQSTNEELTTVNEEMHGRNMELQQANNDLLNLLSSVNIPILMLSSDLRIRRFTPQAEKLFSLLATDAGRPINDLRLKITIPDLPALCHEVLENLTAKDREVQDADGCIYSMSVRPYRTAENRIEGVVLSLFDVTERKHSAEARYRRLFEAASDGIVIADAASGKIVDLNPFVTKLFGFPRARLVNEKFWKSPLFRDTPIDESVLAQLRGGNFLQRTITIPTEGGQQIEAEVVCNVYAEGERKVVQFNIRDISARKKAEARLRREEEQARQTEKLEAVGRLAGGVAHDFNNLLTAILGACGVLNEQLEESHPGHHLLSQITEVAERASLLTKQLLAFGRRDTLQPTVLNVNETMARIQQLLSAMLPKDIDLVLELQARTGLVRADRGQLEQAIFNLVTNARDAIPKTGRITVRTGEAAIRNESVQSHPDVPEGDYVTLSVKDTGTGMEAETVARLFEPFFSTKPRGEGAGMGLSTTHNIVQEAGGYISVSTVLGAGSTFTVYLPRVEGDALEEAAAETSPAGGNETILVVDDEPAILGIAKLSLERLGYRVMTASSGSAAIRMATEHPEKIDLMVTDVVMPQMSGREVAFHLAPQRPDMKVLYMSGHTEAAIVYHGVLQDRAAFLPKPFTLPVLAGKVREVLDRRAGVGG